MTEISWDKLTEENISDLDREALQRCLVQAHLQCGAARSKQLTDKLARDGWVDTCLLACSILQAKSLGLTPFQVRPYAIVNLDAALRRPYGQPHAYREVGEVLKRVLDAGLSRYECDPAGSLKRVEAA